LIFSEIQKKKVKLDLNFKIEVKFEFTNNCDKLKESGEIMGKEERINALKLGCIQNNHGKRKGKEFI
jgi:hypothetical protein